MLSMPDDNTASEADDRLAGNDNADGVLRSCMEVMSAKFLRLLESVQW